METPPQARPVDPAVHRSSVPATDDDRALIRRMLALTPDERLEGLVRAAAFFRSARRV